MEPVVFSMREARLIGVGERETLKNTSPDIPLSGVRRRNWEREKERKREKEKLLFLLVAIVLG